MTAFNTDKLLETQQQTAAALQGLAATTFDSFEKLISLNLATARSVFLESANDTMTVFGAKTPKDALAAQMSLAKPLAEKVVAYGRSTYEITSGVTAEIGRMAQRQMAESQQAVEAALDTLTQNAPAGSESAVAIIKSAMAAGQQAIDAAQTSAKKAMELAEKQAMAVSDTALTAVKTSSRRK